MKKKDKRKGPRSTALRKKMSLAQKRRWKKAEEWSPHVEDKLAAAQVQYLADQQKYLADITENLGWKMAPEPSLIQSIVVGLKSILSGMWK